MRKYYNYSVKKAVTVKNLTTIESLEATLDFSYPPEEHDFFELVYIDYGRLGCRLGERECVLDSGELLLIAPHTVHSYTAIDKAPSAFYILCFHSSSVSLGILGEKKVIEKEERLLFYEIIKEAKSAFAFPFKRKLKPLDSPAFGSQQLVSAKLEELLIRLIRDELNESSFIRPVMNSVELENHLVGDIAAILSERVYSRVTLDEISEQLFYSKTYLNVIFKRATGKTIMKYYRFLKLEEAKRLLSEGASTSEIASRLSFESATYFVKFFKHYENMTPTEFKRR